MHSNFIAGEWVDGSKVRVNLSPSDISDVIGEYAQADAQQTALAIQAARDAARNWGRTTAQAR